MRHVRSYRYSSGTNPTDYTYTGQYSYASDFDFGLMFYNARWYDSSLGRFAQADSMIPSQQGVQAWDRYAYVNNSPVMYTDPSGHTTCDADGYCGYNTINQRNQNGSGGNGGGGGSNDGNEGGCHGVLCSLSGDVGDLLGFVNENFDVSQCEGTGYRCGGNSNFGYVFDPISGEIVTWNNGTDFAVLNDFDIVNGTLEVNLDLFMNEVDSYETNYANAQYAVFFAGVSSAVFVALLYTGAPSNPLGWVALGLDGVLVIGSVGYAVYSFNQTNDNITQINNLFTGILLNTNP